MSSAPEVNRKRRPPKMYLISTDLKVQDHLDGTIRLQRGFMCQEQDKSSNEFLWVKVFPTFKNIPCIHTLYKNIFVYKLDICVLSSCLPVSVVN